MRVYSSSEPQTQLVAFLFFIPTVIAVYLLTDIPDSMSVFITNFLVMLVSYVGFILKHHQPYSLEKMVYVFFFFFFGVIPLNDEFQGNLYWGGGALDDANKVFANLLTLIGLTSFYTATLVRLKWLTHERVFFSRPIVSKKTTFFVLIITIAFLILYTNNFNLFSLLFRGSTVGPGSSAIQFSQLENLIINNYMRPMAFVILVMYLFVYRSRMLQKKLEGDRYEQFSLDKLFLVLLTLTAILLIFPTSVPRFQAAALYIPLIIVFTPLWNKPFTMQLSILGSLLILMPFMDKFRRFDPDSFSWSIDLSSLNHGHFDAYQHFVRCIQADIVTYGSQLTGALLFFVPRAIWDEKPVGSGAELAAQLNLSYSNIAFPYIAEGYINFGVVGLILFMVIIGVIIGNFDRVAWEIKHRNKESLFLYYYYFLFGMVFFIMRGDLMSSFSYTVGLTAAFVTVYFILRLGKLKVRL